VVAIIVLWFCLHLGVTGYRSQVEAWALVHAPQEGKVDVGDVIAISPLRLALVLLGERPRDFFIIHRIDGEPQEFFESHADRLRMAFPEAKVVDVSEP
jgi:hypothetical protein